jgi:hypothetical protein
LKANELEKGQKDLSYLHFNMIPKGVHLAWRKKKEGKIDFQTGYRVDSFQARSAAWVPTLG